MLRILFAVVLLVALAAGAASGVPRAIEEYGTVTPREPVERQDTCHLSYYNICSGWVWRWNYYQVPDVQYGTCFDLSQCPSDCRHLTDVWWACARYTTRGSANVEVYCADAAGCLVGEPLAGVYGYLPVMTNPWQHHQFQGVPLCDCEGGGHAQRFVVLITQFNGPVWPCDFAPYSDNQPENILAGCQAQWRCSGHSFLYRGSVSYCEVYGAPAPLWTACDDCGCLEPPEILPWSPEGHPGVYCEWLIDCYVSCLGPTATAKTSWSAVKALYR